MTSDRLYTRELLRLASDVAKYPPLATPDGAATQRSQACGSVIETMVQLGGDGAIARVGLRVSACAVGQASAAVLAKAAEAATKEQITALRADFADFLAGASDRLAPPLDALVHLRKHPRRHAAALLPFDSLLAGLAAAQAASASRKAATSSS